jgi:hypothetical protein
MQRIGIRVKLKFHPPSNPHTSMFMYKKLKTSIPIVKIFPSFLDKLIVRVSYPPLTADVCVCFEGDPWLFS